MISTVSDLVDALGGTTATARLFDVLPSAVSNWKKTGQFPARLYLPITEVCQARGIEVNRELFGPVVDTSAGVAEECTAPNEVTHPDTPQDAGESPLADSSRQARPRTPATAAGPGPDDSSPVADAAA